MQLLLNGTKYDLGSGFGWIPDFLWTILRENDVNGKRETQTRTCFNVKNPWLFPIPVADPSIRGQKTVEKGESACADSNWVVGSGVYIGVGIGAFLGL